MVKKENLLILAIYFFLAAVISQFFSEHELIKSFLFLGCFLIIPWHFRKDKYILFSLLIGFIIALIVSYWAPYPYIYDTDVFRHAAFINEILEGNFFWGQPAYLGILHNFLALIAKLFNFASFPYVIFWSSRFVIFPLYSLGVFLFIRQATNNKLLAFFAASVAPLTIIEFLSLINFAPKIVSLVILPYLLFWILKCKKINWKIILAISIIAFSVHFYMGLINLFVIFSWLFFRKYNNKKIIYSIVSIALLYIFLQAIGILNLSQKALRIFNEADLSHYSFSFYGERFLEYFSTLILSVALLGLLMRRNDKNILAFSPALFVIIAVYFSPLNASYRVLASIVPIIILFVSIFIIDFYSLLKNKKAKIIFASVISIILIANFCLPYFQKIKKVISLPNNEGYFTIITPQEYRIAYWLRDNDIKDQIIISDPVNALAISSLSGNAYVLAPEEIIKYIMLEKDPQKTFDYIKSKEKELNKKFIISIDGRTSFWVNERKDKEVFFAPNQAKQFKAWPQFKKFKNSQYFVTKNNAEGVYIFELL